MSLSAHTPLRSGIAATTGLRTDRAATVNYAAFPEERYNVIVFLVDDVAREYMSAYDNATWTGTPIDAQWANQWAAGTFAYPGTPRVNALAANGLLFTRMHTAAMCSPTRASLLTGRDNTKHTLGNALVPQVDATEHFYRGKSIYELMDEGGSAYQTGHVGKWHITQLVGSYVDGMAPGLEASLTSLKKPVTYGKVDFFAGNNANQGPYPPGIMDDSDQNDHTAFAWSRYDARENPRTFTGAASGPFAGQTGLTFDAYYTGDLPGDHNALVYTEQAAIDFIEDAAEDGKPFLLNVWFHAPHCPCVWSDTEDQFGIAYLSGQGYHSYGTTSPNNGNIGAQCKAMMQSIDTAVGNIMDAMTADQAARTMVVFLSDNGTAAELLTETTGEADLVDGGTTCIPASRYKPQHSKRAPFEGGIAASCIIHGPAVQSPGNGSVPRVWDGLCGIEDLFAAICHWTGTTPDVDDLTSRSDTLVIRDACASGSAAGRDFYVKQAFNNDYPDDPFSEDQGGQLRWTSVQNAAGWKLLWVKAGASPSDEVTWEWSLFDLNTNYLEHYDAETVAGDGVPVDHGGNLIRNASGATVQDKYDNLASGAKAQFNALYTHLAENYEIPPGMEVTLA